MKGAVAMIPLFMLVGLIAVVSAWIFFIFFKIHVTGLAVDVDSINRYQEIPTTVITSSFSVSELFFPNGGPDNRPKSGTQCFRGDGPIGSHEPNEYLCSKQVPFFYTKFANNADGNFVAKPVLLQDACVNNHPIIGGLISGFLETTGITISFDEEADGLRKKIRSALPDDHYAYIFEAEGAESDYLRPNEDCGDRGNQELTDSTYKINEIYPIPIFLSGQPTVANQRLFIDSVSAGGERLLVTWPKYSTEFRFGEESSSTEVADVSVTGERVSESSGGSE